MDEECTLEAHESEVLCLEFTRPETGGLYQYTFGTNFKIQDSQKM